MAEQVAVGVLLHLQVAAGGEQGLDERQVDPLLVGLGGDFVQVLVGLGRLAGQAEFSVGAGHVEEQATLQPAAGKEGAVLTGEHQGPHVLLPGHQVSEQAGQLFEQQGLGLGAQVAGAELAQQGHQLFDTGRVVAHAGGDQGELEGGLQAKVLLRRGAGQFAVGGGRLAGHQAALGVLQVGVLEAGTDAALGIGKGLLHLQEVKAQGGVGGTQVQPAHGLTEQRQPFEPVAGQLVGELLVALGRGGPIARVVQEAGELGERHGVGVDEDGAGGRLPVGGQGPVAAPESEQVGGAQLVQGRKGRLAEHRGPAEQLLRLPGTVAGQGQLGEQHGQRTGKGRGCGEPFAQGLQFVKGLLVLAAHGLDKGGEKGGQVGQRRTGVLDGDALEQGARLLEIARPHHGLGPGEQQPLLASFLRLAGEERPQRPLHLVPLVALGHGADLRRQPLVCLQGRSQGRGQREGGQQQPGRGLDGHRGFVLAEHLQPVAPVARGDPRVEGVGGRPFDHADPAQLGDEFRVFGRDRVAGKDVQEQGGCLLLPGQVHFLRRVTEIEGQQGGRALTAVGHPDHAAVHRRQDQRVGQDRVLQGQIDAATAGGGGVAGQPVEAEEQLQAGRLVVATDAGEQCAGRHRCPGKQVDSNKQRGDDKAARGHGMGGQGFQRGWRADAGRLGSVQAISIPACANAAAAQGF